MKNPKLYQITDFDLKLLRIFKTIVECGSFSAAESVLGITRSAISLHMTDLEKRVGIRLCQRGRSGFALTDAGREVLQQSELLFAAVEDFRQHINQIHQQLRGDFNIGVIHNLVTLPHMHITHALTQLTQASEQIRIQLSMLTPSEIEQGLFDGRLHIGALPVVSPLSGLEYLPLYTERCSLYCAAAHALFHEDHPDIKALKLYQAIIPTSRLSIEATSLYKKLNCNAEASNREGTAFLILTGRYIGFLPDHYAAQWVKQGLMKAILPEQLNFSSDMMLALPKTRRSNIILDLFLEKINEVRVESQACVL
ncbi:LysR family transcriptional regulator [Acinetobacter larvae]|uniref:LuxR family transcriptional regulator n=1 Tax=Acinetobacter larvae TaxID=1789224 RepID=A0A1B2LXP2_9GAMM|nr:LysR family transcriptional regulator [Acinetobacter larvae]AOA57711.1 LuxR family transcriptional regulator [Acinetobacter larvae]